MKFNFKIQQYQTDAVDSMVGVFKGQPWWQETGERVDGMVWVCEELRSVQEV